jgi:hypothetical protein
LDWTELLPVWHNLPDGEPVVFPMPVIRQDSIQQAKKEAPKKVIPVSR